MTLVKRYTFQPRISAAVASQLNGNFDDIIDAYNAHTHTGLGTDAPLITSSGVSLAAPSVANAGTAGGTTFRINLGSIKMAWLQSAVKSNSSGQNSYSWTLPASFFTTVQSCWCNATDPTSTADIVPLILSYSAATVTVAVVSNGVSTCKINAFAIGT